MKVSSLLVVALAAALQTGATDAVPRVDSGVHRALKRQGTVNLMVTMKEDNKSFLDKLVDLEAAILSRGKKIAAVVDKLISHATDSQSNVLSLLVQEAGETLASASRSFWITNQVYFKDATIELVQKLSSMSGVAEVREEMVFTLPQFVAMSTSNGTAHQTAQEDAPIEWGIQRIQAPQIWAAGNTGQGVVVGSIDSGVRVTHEALRANFRKDFGWYDPETNSSEPYDAYGHGTHTTGIAVGALGIGVAPGAQWIACKGCRTREIGCLEGELLACMEFMTCPTDPTGTIKDCSKAPDIVSNSWGGGQGETMFDAAIKAWHQVGIIPVFSLGNTGPACSSAGSPGDRADVISVGSTDYDDLLGPFSSRGPAVKTGLMKPEISAPGEQVLSAWSTGDTMYAELNGTSMAAPHVSGTVALLLSANPLMTFSDVQAALFQHTDTATLKSVEVCGSPQAQTSGFPNNMYGYGRVNAYAALTGAPAPTPAPTASTAAPTTVVTTTPETTSPAATVGPPNDSTTPAPTTPTTTPSSPVQTAAPATTTAPPPPATTTTTAPPPPATTSPTAASPTAAPSNCDNLGLIKCTLTFRCYWNFLAGNCQGW